MKIVGECASTGYILFPKYWSSGYCKESCLEIIDLVFTSYNINKIIAEIETSNVRYIRLIKSIGFKKIGVNNTATDEYQFELSYNDWLKDIQNKP